MRKRYFKSVTCPICSKERIVDKYSAGVLCNSCSQKRNRNWEKRILEDLSGCKFAHLTVISKVIGVKPGKWNCLCDCGNKIMVLGGNLKSGHTKSCGCIKKTQKCLSKTKAHNTWYLMKHRCYNPLSNHWNNYGGRGITVCERWEKSFLAFFEDMGQAPPNKTLDRIDNNGSYCKENCKWSTRKEQCRNRRSNRIISAFGKTQCIPDWSDEVGLSVSIIYKRIMYYGWTPEDALTFLPCNTTKKKRVKIKQ